MVFEAGELPASVVLAAKHHNIPAIKAWLDLDDAHLAARDRERLMSLTHWAVLLPSLPLLDELVRRSAPLDIPQHHGATPLLVAALVRSEPAMRMLLDGRADPNVADASGTTPLMVACRHGGTGAAALLLDAGAEPTRRDRHGRNALALAVEKGHKGICMVFRQRFRGTPVWAALKDGFEAPIHVAQGLAGTFVARPRRSRGCRTP